MGGGRVMSFGEAIKHAKERYAPLTVLLGNGVGRTYDDTIFAWIPHVTTR
jgi:hypothetical protein